ncbi:hypothetical protein NQ318_009820, partial [Aromia moschata]
IEEGDRGQDMTASPDNSGADRNGANNRNEDGVYTVSVTGGYDNQAFKRDGGDGVIVKPPREITDEEASQQGKFKLSTKEKWRILKNVSAISCAFMIQFTAFQGTANLQSSINAKDGLGTVSLCAVYAALVVSCIFVPTFLIKKLTVKWTLCLSLMCYAPYIGSQFYPRFYTLVPAGVLLGIGAAPMWASKATYLTQVAGIYAKLTDQAVDGIIVRFFGFFFLAWQTAEVWGNLISSLEVELWRLVAAKRSNMVYRDTLYIQIIVSTTDQLDQASPTPVLLPLRPSAGQAPEIKCKNMMLSVSVAQRRLFCGRGRTESGILSNPHGTSSSTNSTNYESCGANFCSAATNNDNLNRPDDKEIYEISGIYLACIIAAVIMIALVVDPLSRYVQT